MAARHVHLRAVPEATTTQDVDRARCGRCLLAVARVVDRDVDAQIQLHLLEETGRAQVREYAVETRQHL